MRGQYSKERDKSFKKGKELILETSGMLSKEMAGSSAKVKHRKLLTWVN